MRIQRFGRPFFLFSFPFPLAAAVLVGTLAAGGAAAQAYPTKPIRLIVPFGAGGGSDYVGRLVGVKLTEQTGQTVVVDRKSTRLNSSHIQKSRMPSSA